YKGGVCYASTCNAGDPTCHQPQPQPPQQPGPQQRPPNTFPPGQPGFPGQQPGMQTQSPFGGACLQRYICTGNTLYYQAPFNNQCSTQPVQQCQFGCLN